MPQSLDNLKEDIRKNLLKHGKDLDEDSLDALAEVWELKPSLGRKIERGICQL